jgi:hypothetical protein
MSSTPAAHLARLKVTYQGWRITGTADGFTAPWNVRPAARSRRTP